MHICNDIGKFDLINKLFVRTGGSHSTRSGGKSYSSTYVKINQNTRQNKGVGSRRKPKIPAHYVQSTSAPSQSGFKESNENPNFYKGESIGDHSQELHGGSQYATGGFSPSSDIGYQGPTVSDHSYEEPTKTDYDYQAPAPVSDYSYKGPTPESDYDYKGPSPISNQEYQGPVSNEEYNGPTPIDQGYTGPTPSNFKYDGPTPANHGYNSASVSYNGVQGSTKNQGNNGAIIYGDNGFRVSWTTNSGSKSPLKISHKPKSSTKTHYVKSGLGDTTPGTSIHASASGPGATFSHPVIPSPEDHGPVVYHNHHYTGQTIDDSFFDFPTNIQTPKLTNNDQLQFTKSTHGLKTTFGHTCSSNEVTPIPPPSKYPDFDFSKFPELKEFRQHTKPAINPSPHSSLTDNEFYSKFFGKSYPSGGRKGKWKPVIITSSKSKYY